MSVSAAIRRMLEAGLTIDQALIAAEAFEAETFVQEPVTSKRQARNKRYYERLKSSEKRLNVSETSNSDGGDFLPSPEGSSPKPLSPKPLSSLPPSPPKGGSSPTDFENFWAKYPHKVGKRDAEKAFSQAIRRDSVDAIMDGLDRYARKTDDRPWCNPSTFLNQDRWSDAPASVALHRSGTSPPSGNRKRNYLDAALDLIGEQENGSENSFGNGSNVEFLPPRKQRSGPDTADLSEHPWQPFITGNH